MRTRWRTALMAVAIAVAIASTGCTVPPLGGGFLPGEPPSPPPGLPARVTRGCSNGAPTRPAGTTTQTISVDGVERTFLLTVPDQASGAHPLLFDFHGAGSNGQQEWFYSRLATKGQARGYVTITPTANGPIWAIPPSPVDLHLVDTLVRWIGDTTCIDRDRIYAAGLSNGSSMAAGLGCHRRGVFAAVGLVAGPNIYPTCTEAPPIPYLAFHGTADAVVPYQAGLALGSYPVRAVEEVVAEIARDRNHCQAGPVTATLAADVQRRTYGPCAMAADTVLYTILGGGHTWPGAVFDIPALGPVTHSIDASELMLDFFDAHPR